jgi:hypothetical protein
MRKFSERIGKTPIKSIIQKEDIDNPLSNAMWNGLSMFYWEKITENTVTYNSDEVRFLLARIWLHYFKNRIDEEPWSKDEFLSTLKDHFFSCEWFEKYNLIEFVKNNYTPDFHDDTTKEFIEYCNDVFERELSGYRFLNGVLTPIISTEEIQSIENALNIADSFKPVKTHLNRALQLLSDRANPDYRNSVKESISAVESYCCILANDPKATLGQALKIIEKEHFLHSALKNSFSSLYGYTSDADGIRHALLEEDNLKQEDAIFMLVSCSSFINYLIKKTSKAN